MNVTGAATILNELNGREEILIVQIGRKLNLLYAHSEEERIKLEGTRFAGTPSYPLSWTLDDMENDLDDDLNRRSRADRAPSSF